MSCRKEKYVKKGHKVHVCVKIITAFQSPQFADGTLGQPKPFSLLFSGTEFKNTTEQFHLHLYKSNDSCMNFFFFLLKRGDSKCVISQDLEDF